MSIRPKAIAHGSRTLVAAYIADGYLYGASDSPNAYAPSYWPGLADEVDGYQLAELANVPDEVAERLMAQGTSGQFYADGYEAATAAAPYVGATVHEVGPDDDGDDDEPCACGGRIDPDTDLCESCGVHHGDPCPSCGGRGYHADGCPESDDDGPPVAFALSPDEADALSWLSARYESARILWDAWEWGDEENVGTVPAGAVRAAHAATAGDGGGLGVVPCAGAGLAYAIAEAFERAGCDR